MKNLAILFFIFSFFGVSKAQFTKPMPDTSANWTITTSFYDIGTFTYYYAHDRNILVGDTLINGFNYYQISQANDINDTTAYSFPLYRIDSNKVYFLVNDSTERLEYDYGMQIGDSILLTDDFTYGILQSIDTLTIFSGHEITRFNFGNGTDWYYGIGSSAGFENYEYCECAIELTSYYYKGECYIFSGNSNLCEANLLSVEESKLENNFSVYPNPSTGKFTLETDNYLNAVYEILDLNGKIISSSKINNSITELELNIAFGIYIIKLQYLDSVITRKLIIQ